MAARCQGTYSSTPASLIYAQSWPVPFSQSLAKRYPGKPASNSPGKSLNSSWIYKAKKQNTTPRQATSSSNKSHSWASSMLSNQYPEWIIEDDSHIKLDMAKEFKLTLQMFKKLTQQVKEVDDQMNSCRKPYLFKHYFTNKDNPGIHRSQLAANMRSFTPEVPMTNQAYQPCNNFTLKREKQRRPHSHLGVYRKSDKSLNSIIPKPKPEALSSTIPVKKKSGTNQSEKCKSLDQKYQETPSKEECLNIQSCKDFSWSSSADLNSEEDLGFGYIDPVPDDWDKKKLEELEQEYFADKKEKQDPFLKRYLELCRLQAETLENERCNPKMEESIENVSGLNCGSAKTNGNGNSQGKKLCSSKKHSSRTSDEKIKVKNSGFKSNLDVNKYSKSCVSKYVEGKMEKKKGDYEKEKKTSKRSKSARTRKKVPNSTNSYQSSSVTQYYDIVELALSFDPPSKDRINLKSRPVTVKSAKSKGLLPGKSWYSQRRFSLTSDQACLDTAPDNNDVVPVSFNKPTSAKKGRQKSAKRITKRCASSKQF